MSEHGHYLPGANWTSKDGKRNIVIERELSPFRERQFSVRNLSTKRITHIGITGLSRKFRFVGYDPAYEPAPRTPAASRTVRCDHQEDQ